MKALPRLVLFALISSTLMACTTLMQAPLGSLGAVSPPAPVKPPEPEPEMVSIPIVVSPTVKSIIPEGSRIVIMNIAGATECTDAVKDALMRRLIDNSGYEVLSRDNLEQIIGESNINWGGRFNTETTVKLGELLGASYFVVGRVAYCGYSASEFDNDAIGSQYTVVAVLQIIDLKTGKVMVSSAAEGRYSPLPAPKLDSEKAVEGSSADGDSREEGSASSANWMASQAAVDLFTRNSSNPFSIDAGASTLKKAALDWLASRYTTPPSADTMPPMRRKPRIGPPEPRSYGIMKAADDMASGFADNFFARPTWEKVEMWFDQRWEYNESVRYVRLGHCPEARTFLDQVASDELPHMPDQDVAMYLHNYGVALLCENNSDMAVQKLQSAYRIAGNLSTLRMLGLASKIKEWSLRVEVDREPLVDMILKRDTYVVKN